jgi:hypothetical protein
VLYAPPVLKVSPHSTTLPQWRNRGYHSFLICLTHCFS